MEAEKGNFTPEQKSPAPEKSVPSGKCFLWTQVTIRILVIAFALCSICITVTSDQTVGLFGPGVIVDPDLTLRATYKYSPSFRFQVGANAVVCAFVFCSLIYVVASNCTKSKSSLYFYLFLHDIVMTVLIISGSAAATAIGYLGRYGQKQSGWMAICDKATKFCHKMTIALAFSYLSFFSLLLLTFILAHKLKSLATTL